MHPDTITIIPLKPQPIFDDELEEELLRDRVIAAAKGVEAALKVTDHHNPNNSQVKARLKELSDAVWELIVWEKAQLRE